jgi:hypothetical protein
MYPPFHVVDHRIDHDILPVEERRVIRRGRPEPLRFDLPPPGTPVLIVGSVGPPPVPDEAGLIVRALRAIRARLARRRAEGRP